MGPITCTSPTLHGSINDHRRFLSMDGSTPTHGPPPSLTIYKYIVIIHSHSHSNPTQLKHHLPPFTSFK
ncbi:hypothetical protein VNO78_25350 [Psophocarpus tetragonolobus]|uniref:Uncharacterized protein n=1 Tax=Psophocarpus tetragonolobus TaxID=3891 RepID=A0AAN9S6Z1_PSOTE